MKEKLIQELVIEEKQTLRAILRENTIDHQIYAVLVNNKRVSDLNTEIIPGSKIIVLPKIRGG